jgi:hypothetical protein
MPRLPVLIAIAAAALAPHASAAATERRPPVKLQVETSQEPSPGRLGQELEVLVRVGPPEGVELNRYPGIRLEIEDAPGFRAEERRVFLGSEKPVADPKLAYFKEIAPLRLGLVPDGAGPGTRTIRARLVYFYCVTASGFCAPGRQTLEIPVTLAAD